MQDWGKEHGLSKDKGLLTSNQQVKLTTLTTCIKRLEDYNLIFGVGFAFKMRLKKLQKTTQDVNYVMIDDRD